MNTAEAVLLSAAARIVGGRRSADGRPGMSRLNGCAGVAKAAGATGAAGGFGVVSMEAVTGADSSCSGWGALAGG